MTAESNIDRAKLEEAIKVARKAVDDCDEYAAYVYPADIMRLVTQAAEAHLETIPKTKMVPAWRVEYAQVKAMSLTTWEPVSAAFGSLEEAESYAKEIGRKALTACIRVTGPHAHEVPA